MSTIIGRKQEIKELNTLYNSGKAELVAIYGRRRVGKTFLIDEALKGNITFRHAGLSPVDTNVQNNKNTANQLKHFYNSLILHGMKRSKTPQSWLDAFLLLEQHLQNIDNGNRQVIFLDELPWMDTPRSGFLTAFEGFWNTWACHRDNIMVVVCGSASSWILDNMINNHGGLYGRTTHEIKLNPFTLSECEQFLNNRNVQMSRYDIVRCYMALGGIPYYLNYLEPGKSLVQCMDKLFYSVGAKLANEYDKLFQSIFSEPDTMRKIVDTLGKRHKGFSRPELLASLRITDSGSFSKRLKALEACDFIQKYIPFGESKREVYYRLVDPFCIFCQKYVNDHKTTDHEFWSHNENSQSVVSWQGIAFENVCMTHISAIKRALGISGVASEQSAWTIAGSEDNEGAQIDLLIVRNDNVVNMCEIKFYSDEFAVDKSYHTKLLHRINMLLSKVNRKASIHSTLITTFGLKYNEYSGGFVKIVTLEDLFAE